MIGYKLGTIGRCPKLLGTCVGKSGVSFRFSIIPCIKNYFMLGLRERAMVSNGNRRLSDQL